MEAKDLRIGNFILVEEKVYEVEMNDSYGVLGIDKRGLVRLENVKPIPITEEWLIKLGFKRLSDRIYINGDIGYDFGINKGAVLKRNECFLMFNNIHKVHELQNFYFAITGKEL